MIPKEYKGREQALIKHTLLKHYLQKLIMIKGPYEECITYVDCLAGPWEEKSSDLFDTSIGISLNIMRECQQQLSKRFNKNIKFRALYIEKNEKSFRKLKDFLNSHKTPGIETKAMEGVFHKQREQILDWCDNNSFAFFFIDPKGYKNLVEPGVLECLINREKSEFLINFQYDYIKRFVVGNDPDGEIRMFGRRLDISPDLSPYEKEKLIVDSYRRYLVSKFKNKFRLRTAYVPVFRPQKDQVQYHLVFLTRHELGIVKFMEVSQELQPIQQRVRAEAQLDLFIENTGQQLLLERDDYVEVISQYRDINEVKVYWLSKLSSVPTYFGIKELANMQEEKGWFESDFQKAFKELQDERKVKNSDATGQRPKKPIHFYKNKSSNLHQGERLVKLST